MHLEQYEQQASWRGSIWMFVAGTAIGACAALMMAPATGRESREYIRKQGKKLGNDFSTQADKVASAMKWGQEHASSAVKGTVDSAKAAINAAKSYRTGESTQTNASTSQTSTSSSPRPTPARPNYTSS
ncbi:MAG TPA: YtxH domain-containing protein [Vicinamibacterales bacterium]|jgi:gas vesicle protein